MSKISVDYDEHRSWGYAGAPRKYCPYEEIVLHGSTTYERIWCLVDSGADDVQVNKSVASRIGIDLINGPGRDINVQTASGGTTSVREVPNLSIDIEQFRIYPTCLFGGNNIPILGRNALLMAMDFGFDVKGWFLKYS